MDSSSIDYRLCKLSLSGKSEKILDMFPKVPEHVVSKTAERIMEISKEPSVIKDKEHCRNKPNLRIRIPKSFTI